MAKKKTLTKAEIAKVDRLLKDTFKDVLDPTNKENKKYKEKLLKQYKADRLLKDTYKDVLDPTTKENKKHKEKILKKLRKAGIKIGLAGLAGPAGMLAAGISESFAATPAGDPDEISKLRKLETAGLKGTEAGRKRAVPGASKKKGGKMKKNYAKGSVVRSANY